MSRLSQKAIAELIKDLPSPSAPAEKNAHILQLQRRVALQQKCIDDLGRAIRHLQQQLYLLKQQD